MKKVLFVCIHNSARSQMAEAYMNKFGNEKFTAESAGLEPGKLNQDVVKVMKEDKIDISGNKTKNVYEFSKEGKEYDYVITVCDEASGEKCPYFPGGGQRQHWSFEDPSALKETGEEKFIKIRNIRNEIKNKVIEFINAN